MWDTITFFTAISNGEKDRVVLYLNQRIPVDTKNEHGIPAINMAAMLGHATIVELLLSKGAKPDSKTDSGFLPSHGAIMGGHLAVLRVLAQYMAHFSNDSPHYKRDELQLAVELGHVEIVTFLLTQPVDCNKRDARHLTALDLSKQHTQDNYRAIHQLLSDYMFSPKAKNETHSYTTSFAC